MSIGGIVFYTARGPEVCPASGRFFLVCRLAYLKRHSRRIDRKAEALVFLFVVYRQPWGHHLHRSAAHLLDWWTLPHGMDTVSARPAAEDLAHAPGGRGRFFIRAGQSPVVFPIWFFAPRAPARTKIRRIALYSCCCRWPSNFPSGCSKAASATWMM